MIANIPGANTATMARGLIMAALTPLLVWGTHPARAQDEMELKCGATIGPAEVEVFLEGDIGPCDKHPEGSEGTDTALTIVGPVTVNLNGFTISCVVPDDEEEGPIGIEVEGVNALVLNGVVEDCEDGVVLADDEPESGQHIITQLRVRSSRKNQRPATRGFRVQSDGNQLFENKAKHFNGEGFRVEGNDNVLVNNVAFRNFDEGFRIKDGEHNTLFGNKANRNGITDGEAGVRIQGSFNTVIGNAFKYNFGSGILVKDETGDNTIIVNVAVRNRNTDLVDENVIECDGNLWSDNRFRTRSPDCIE